MAIVRRLYVVTHPEAQHHVDGLVGGWYDSELSHRGLQQAGLIAAELRRRIPAAAAAQVISSDLKRTWTTALAIAEPLGSTAEANAGLREKSYGIAEGRPQSWLDERFVFPPLTGNRLDHVEGIEGPETKRQAGSRIYAAMDEILTRPVSHQVIITHGFAHTFVVASWLELPLEAMGRATFAASSGCITELVEDDVFGNRTLRRVADTQHLAGD